MTKKEKLKLESAITIYNHEGSCARVNSCSNCFIDDKDNCIHTIGMEQKSVLAKKYIKKHRKKQKLSSLENRIEKIESFLSYRLETPPDEWLEETKRPDELQQIENELVALISEINGDWFPDWSDCNQLKHSISYCYNSRTSVNISYTLTKKLPNNYYCKRKFLEDAQKKIGLDRLNKYLAER